MVFGYNGMSGGGRGNQFLFPFFFFRWRVPRLWFWIFLGFRSFLWSNVSDPRSPWVSMSKAEAEAEADTIAIAIAIAPLSPYSASEMRVPPPYFTLLLSKTIPSLFIYLLRK